MDFKQKLLNIGDSFRFVVSCILCSYLICQQGLGQSAEITPVDPKIRNIITNIVSKLSRVKGYTAVVETQALDPNGGIDKFRDEQTVCMPDKMFVKRQVLVAHNHDAVGQNIAMAVDGSWLISRIDGARVNERFPNKPPSYSKTNLKAVEQAGGLTVAETISLMGNLAAPLQSYKTETLKLEQETPISWILLAEYKQNDAKWPIRLTIDKKMGLLRKVEAMIPGLDQPVILLCVNKVSLKDRLDDSLFRMDLPQPDSSDYSLVTDYTKDCIENLKSRQHKRRDGSNRNK